MKDMKDISASAQEALEHARDKAFGKVKPGILEPLKSVPVNPIMAWYFEKQNPQKSKKFQFWTMRRVPSKKSLMKFKMDLTPLVRLWNHF